MGWPRFDVSCVFLISTTRETGRPPDPSSTPTKLHLHSTYTRRKNKTHQNTGGTQRRMQQVSFVQFAINVNISLACTSVFRNSAEGVAPPSIGGSYLFDHGELHGCGRKAKSNAHASRKLAIRSVAAQRHVPVGVAISIVVTQQIVLLAHRVVSDFQRLVYGRQKLLSQMRM